MDDSSGPVRRRPYRLRRGGTADADAIGRFQTETWNDVYVGLVPQSYLDGVTAEMRAERWRERLRAGNRTVTVAEVDGAIVGAASAGDRGTGFELMTLYVARAYWGSGLADDLIRRAIGVAAAELWVFTGNSRATNFYARHGFAPDGGRMIDPGTGIEEFRMRRGRQRNLGGMTARISHWIDGRSHSTPTARTAPVYNPATGAVAAEVELASTAEVDAAIASAATAAVAWRSSSLSKRANVLFAFRALLHDRADDLAAIITAEHGKVLSDAGGEIARGMENVEFACGVPQLLKGGFSEQAATGIDVYSIRQPLGVVAGITPFNFPAMVPLWMCANAIACGNAFVLKPSEKDPSSALFIAQLWKDAGLPDGVFTVVNGDKEAVDAILASPTVKAVSFVGSTPIARYIYSTGTANGKRVQALGGAKNHMVVLPDADVNMAADAAVSAAYGSAGERCMAISVAVAVGGVGDALIDAISERLPKLKIGAGTDPSSEMGPLITREHRDKVADYIGAGQSDGATVVVDGRSADVPTEGFFLGVTLLDHVTAGMSVYTDEIFGPVLCVLRVDTYAEAVQLINDNPYGNGTAIYTRDGGAARQFQFEVEAGMVGINVPIPVPVGYYSFGGWKASLFGDTHMYGPEGVNFFTRGKVVTSRWPDPTTSTVDLGFPRNH